jgi:hypothetical protein
MHDVVTADRLKAYKEAGEAFDLRKIADPPLPQVVAGRKEYVVERILADREVGLPGRRKKGEAKRTKRLYKVKREGIPFSGCTWQSRDDLEGPSGQKNSKLIAYEKAQALKAAAQQKSKMIERGDDLEDVLAVLDDEIVATTQKAGTPPSV